MFFGVYSIHTAALLAELLCVGLVRKTEIVTVQEFKG
jgi:hypothetical protein